MVQITGQRERIHPMQPMGTAEDQLRLHRIGVDAVVVKKAKDVFVNPHRLAAQRPRERRTVRGKTPVRRQESAVLASDPRGATENVTEGSTVCRTVTHH